MTGRLMARLFIVPALIVSVMLVIAVVVVMFGTTTLDRRETINDLLTRIEADSGDRTAGYLLMPQAKDAWRAAQELARRLSQKEKFLRPEEFEPTARRIGGILERYDAGRNVDEPASVKQYFLMMALAELESPGAVPVLKRFLNDPNWNTRRTALQALGEMANVPAARDALPEMVALLEDEQPAVQIVACAAVSALARPGDAREIRALKARLTAEPEVQWNAALGLARLGDASGKLVLMNMLDRSYWEEYELVYDEGQVPVRRKYTEAEVARNLQVAVEAAARLDDDDLAALIHDLRDDASLVVREAVRNALSRQRADDGGSDSASVGVPGPSGEVL